MIISSGNTFPKIPRHGWISSSQKLQHFLNPYYSTKILCKVFFLIFTGQSFLMAKNISVVFLRFCTVLRSVINVQIKKNTQLFMGCISHTYPQILLASPVSKSISYIASPKPLTWSTDSCKSIWLPCPRTITCSRAFNSCHFQSKVPVLWFPKCLLKRQRKTTEESLWDKFLPWASVKEPSG